MQKNWYIIYTKPKCEKKVAALLTKKKIENFCPINCKNTRQLRKSKVLEEPLFTSYVFAYIEENEFLLLRKLKNVVNLVYWKNEPATVKNEEIENIKEFTTYYQDIKLERTQIKPNGESEFLNARSYSTDGKILMIKNRLVKANLPSLGFTMIVTPEKEGVIGREISFGTQKLSLQEG